MLENIKVVATGIGITIVVYCTGVVTIFIIASPIILLDYLLSL